MKYRYIQIFSFLVALLSFSIFSACEVDDKINFVPESPSNGTENGHEYVDLGLTVKWATCNVGASSPEEYGDYFAWGEVEPKETYNFSTYKWCNGSYDTLTKYCTDSDYGTVDNKTTLEMSDDAAHANWGGSWRMPTDTELTVLKNNCTWTWTTQNGVKGYKVTSKKNGNFIFLPAAGYRGDNSDLNGAGDDGRYWSSSLHMGGVGSYGASDLSFNSSLVLRSCASRYYGYSVRPVLGESEEEVTDPTVTTAAITQITETSAVAGGNVTSDGNASVTERGIVYSTNPNPVITNLYNTIKPCGSGTGSFTCDLTNLQPNTTYYVRAYATNSVGTAYGEEVSFTTEVVANPPYLTAMPFSISASKQIYFSSGNLQYHPANKEWRFAESQLDYIGYANSNCSSNYNGWIDLFGWSGSTSYANFGVSTSILTSDYSGSFVDWGTNKIGNDVPNTWRTLTYDEWGYILYNRYKAKSFYGIAQVNGVNGLVLLPDTWECPSGVTFKSGFNTTYGDDYAAYQTFTSEQWSKLESAGAVFLPAAGYRDGSDVRYVQGHGYYWSATEESSGSVSHLYFYSGGAYMDGLAHFYGRSVRLVKDIEGGTTPDTPTESENTENGHEYVDLGLSVKWATCNVGATKPEEYGDYFAWGETQPTDYYDWSTYKWCNGSPKTHTKYCTDSYFGTVDNKTTLEMSDDAAHANWGGSWRMPTKAERDELLEQCTWTWTTQNGVNGYKVTSKKNGNSIFLPAAGYRYYSSLDSAGSRGCYWSSMINSLNSLAYVLDFNSDIVSSGGDSGRSFGNSVRPVCP